MNLSLNFVWKTFETSNAFECNLRATIIKIDHSNDHDSHRTSRPHELHLKSIELYDIYELQHDREPESLQSGRFSATGHRRVIYGGGDPTHETGKSSTSRRMWSK